MRSREFYWKMTRPHTLGASIIPVLAGLSYAIYTQLHFYIIPGIALLLCATLIQIATNLFNEYYDFKNGVDDENSVGIGGGIVNNDVEPKHVLIAAFALYGISGLLGIYLALISSLLLLVIGAICLAIGYLYTGGPYPISSTPFGELFAGTLMGTGFFLIAYYTQTGHVTLLAFLMSIPLMILIALLLTANSLRDRIEDKKGGRKTLAILLGHEGTVCFMIVGFTLAYVWLIVLKLYGQSFLILLPLLTFLYPCRCIHFFNQEKKTRRKLMYGMKYCSLTLKYFGLVYVCAILLETALELFLL